MGWIGKFFGGGDKVLPEEVTTLDRFIDAVTKSELPVIVDVYGRSCGPCTRLGPVLVNVATRHRERVRIVAISTESEAELMARLAVSSTPTIIVFDKGQEVGRMTGFRPESWFDELIETEFPR